MTGFALELLVAGGQVDAAAVSDHAYRIADRMRSGLLRANAECTPLMRDLLEREIRQELSHAAANFLGHARRIEHAEEAAARGRTRMAQLVEAIAGLLRAGEPERTTAHAVLELAQRDLEQETAGDAFQP